MGAVLHTLNIRLFPEQLTYVVNHAEDRVDHRRRHPRAAARPRRRRARDGRALHRRRRRRRLARSRRQRATPRVPPLRRAARRRRAAGFDWPEIDERAAAAMCYTSGTTGNPKGVVYSHRSTFLHSLGVQTASGVPLHVARPRPADRADVPRQRVGHAVRGVHGRRDLLMPGRFLQAEPLTQSSRTSSPRLRARCRRSGPTSSATPSEPRHRPLVAARSCAVARPCRAR